MARSRSPFAWYSRPRLTSPPRGFGPCIGPSRWRASTPRSRGRLIGLRRHPSRPRQPSSATLREPPRPSMRTTSMPTSASASWSPHVTGEPGQPIAIPQGAHPTLGRGPAQMVHQRNWSLGFRSGSSSPLRGPTGHRAPIRRRETRIAFRVGRGAGHGTSAAFGVLAPARARRRTFSQLSGWFSAALQAPEVSQSLSHRGSFRLGCAAPVCCFSASNMMTSAKSFAKRASRRSKVPRLLREGRRCLPCPPTVRL